MFNKKSGPNKRISKTKTYEETSGPHKVSSDGSHVSIGGTTFKRTVLPSVTKPRSEDIQINDQLENIDQIQVQESGD